MIIQIQAEVSEVKFVIKNDVSFVVQVNCNKLLKTDAFLMNLNALLPRSIMWICFSEPKIFKASHYSQSFIPNF